MFSFKFVMYGGALWDQCDCQLNLEIFCKGEANVSFFVV